MSDVREQFEACLKQMWPSRNDPYLRPCNDPEPDRDYQDFDVDFAWQVYKACAEHMQAKLEGAMTNDTERRADLKRVIKVVDNSIADYANYKKSYPDGRFYLLDNELNVWLQDLRDALAALEQAGSRGVDDDIAFRATGVIAALREIGEGAACSTFTHKGMPIDTQMFGFAGIVSDLLKAYKALRNQPTGEGK